MKKLITAAALAAFAIGGHATVTSSTTGNVTTLTENFDGGTSFSSFYSGWKDAPETTDDYLQVGTAIWNIPQSTSLTFATVAINSNVTVSFYYASWISGTWPIDQILTIRLDGTDHILVSTGTGVYKYAYLNNPGPDGVDPVAQADRLASFSWSNVGANANHTLTLFTGSTKGQVFSVDDFTVTISAVPEPETYAMLLAGLGVMGAVARRRKAN